MLRQSYDIDFSVNEFFGAMAVYFVPSAVRGLR